MAEGSILRDLVILFAAALPITVTADERINAIVVSAGEDEIAARARKAQSFFEQVSVVGLDAMQPIEQILLKGSDAAVTKKRRDGGEPLWVFGQSVCLPVIDHLEAMLDAP